MNARDVFPALSAALVLMAGTLMWQHYHPAVPAYELMGDDQVRRAVVIAKHVGTENDASRFRCQTGLRLGLMIYPESYEMHYIPKPADIPIWTGLLNNSRASPYARLCACFFLFDTDPQAIRFLEKELRSSNPRLRFNAATVLVMFMLEKMQKSPQERPPQWSIELSIRLLADGSLDRIDTPETRGLVSLGEGFESDSGDILATPCWDFCWVMGNLKEQSAVSALISVLERNPANPTAARALGDIGDPKAIPILMKILTDKTGYDHSEITALAAFKHKPAVPILCARLGHPETTFGGFDIVETEIILNALNEIGDKSAVPIIKAFIPLSDNPRNTSTAKRVLIQLEQDDPVSELLKLLHEKSAVDPPPQRNDNGRFVGNMSDILMPGGDEFETMSLMQDLRKYKDVRVVAAFADIARTSKFFDLRQYAITLLALPESPAVHELAGLLKADFPKSLYADPKTWASDARDAGTILRDLIVDRLKSLTQQDFGFDAERWLRWAEEHSAKP